MKMAKLTLTHQLDEVSCRMKKIVAAASRLRAHFGDGPHCEALAEISGQAALADETLFANKGDSEANFITDGDLSCPHCGGSGHAGDVRPNA